MDNKTTSNTAEYKFAESEASVSDAAISSATTEQQSVSTEPVTRGIKLPFKIDFKNINWKKHKIPIIIVFSILVIYALFNFYSAKKVRMLEQQKIT